jgi:glycosyltransferase involved in cell wall biosynthesis
MPASDLIVALVSTQRHWHGGEEQARLLLGGLRRRGCRCVVLARRGGVFAERMAAEGFEVVTFTGGGRNPAALWQMRRALRRLRPDVLHYNDSHAIIAAGLATLGLHVPARIAARRVDFPLRWPLAYRLFCDRVVCVSQAVRRVCREGGVPDAMLRVVHDGVDPAGVAAGERHRGRQSLGLADEQILLLTVAKLTDHKGHRFLLEALPDVIRQLPNAVVALAGDGELRESLERQAEQLGVKPHVRFLGFRNDVYDLIQAADVFVLPSHMEGLCSTLIDVMLARRTIVTTTAGGIPDLVGNDEPSGGPVAWLVQPREPKTLAEAILHALASREESARMQERARRRAEERFTADSMVEATLAVYRETACGLADR